jgi:hypothetical protein
MRIEVKSRESDVVKRSGISPLPATAAATGVILALARNYSKFIRVCVVIAT